jgi:ParB family chromosome partitioning protein
MAKEEHRMNTPLRQIVCKPLNWLKFDNVRQLFDEQALVELGKSLRRRQWYPVVARPDGTVIDGERRARAAALEGLDSLDVLIIDEPMTKPDLRLAQFATAFHHADLTAGERYLACYEMLQLRPDWKDKDVADHLGIRPETVSKIMAASRTIPTVRQAMLEGKLGMTDVYAISKVSEAEQPALLEAKLNGASRDALEEQVKATRRRATPATASEPRASTIRIPFSSGVCITVSGKNLSLDDLVEAFAEAAKEARKGRDQFHDFKTWLAVMRDKAKVGQPLTDQNHVPMLHSA